MIASNDHGQPSLAPRCTCGELLTLPQVYLDLMFGKTVEDAPDSEAITTSQSDFFLAAE